MIDMFKLALVIKIEKQVQLLKNLPDYFETIF